MPTATKSSYVCDQCGSRTRHFERVDAYGCMVCDRWQEEACSDPTCAFCAKRTLDPHAELDHSIFMGFPLPSGLTDKSRINPWSNA